MSVGNTKYGDGALKKNINGSNNSAFGICSSRDTDASWNTSFGAYANMSNTVGISNVAVGTNSLLLDISGSYNTAIGTATLLNNLANSNTAIGSNSMENNIIGKENVAIGIQSGYENIDGSKNIFIGAYAGFNNSNGSNNIFLGADTNIANTSKTYNNSTAIGYGSIIDSSNQIMLGTTEENVIIPGNAYSTNILPNYTEQSLVTKKYVDTYVSGGIQITQSCDVATTMDISLSGINVPSAIDNYPLNNGMRVLVRCQDSSNNVSIPNINNGIYDYYNYGSSAELIRASDCSGNNVKGQATFIRDGNDNKSYIFVQTNYDTLTNEAIAGVYPLLYQDFQKIDFSIGNGLEIIGNTLQVKSNLTDTNDDPYLTDIGILGTLSVGGDTSLNSNVDISGVIRQNPSTSPSFNNNVLTKSAFYMYGNNNSGTSIAIAEMIDDVRTYDLSGIVQGRGLYFFPNMSGNVINSIIQQNDSAITSRLPSNQNSLTLSNYGGPKNGIRISSTSATSGSVKIQSGNNSIITNATSNISITGDTSFNSKIDVSGTLSVLNTDAYVNNIRIGRGKNNLNTNTVVGTNSGNNITTGQNNVFIGYESGITNLDGSYNTFVGYQSGKYDSSGNLNTFVGYYSGLNVKRDQNVAIGAFSLSGSNNTGINNTTVGYFSGADLTNGRDNVFLGKSSGQNMIDGCFNAFIGTGSGYKSTSGQRNACLGNDSGSNIQGNFNVLIGASTDTSGNIDNSIAIGYDIKVDTSNTIIIGKSLHNSQIPGKLKVSSDASFNSFLDASSLIVRNDASFNSKMRVNGDASFNSFLDASSLIVRNNVSFSKSVNMNSSEIYNCSAIRSTNNQNITIEATGSGDIILKNNNIDAITISDTPEITIKYPVSFESNTASNREMQLSSINFSDSVGGYGISTRAKIFNDGSYLNIVNLNQPGFTEFKVKDPLGNNLIPIAIDYLGVSLSGNSKILGKLNVSNDASFNSNLDVLGNSKISGKLYVNNDSSFNGIIQQISSDSSKNKIIQNIISKDIEDNPNIFKYSEIRTKSTVDASGTPSLVMTDDIGGTLYFFTNCNDNAWNDLMEPKGKGIISRENKINLSNFSLATWCEEKHGIRLIVDPSSAIQPFPQIKTELWCGNNQSIIMDNSLGYISMNGKLRVSNDASFNSTVDMSSLIVRNDASFNAKLKVNGDASFNSNVDISGKLITRSDISSNNLLTSTGYLSVVSNNSYSLVNRSFVESLVNSIQQPQSQSQPQSFVTGYGLTLDEYNVLSVNSSLNEMSFLGAKNNISGTIWLDSGNNDIKVNTMRIGTGSINSTNTLVGTNVGISGYNNTLIGYTSGQHNTSGYDNVFVGCSTGIYSSNGYHNTFIGSNAGIGNNGYCNTLIGSNTGGSNNGCYNTLIGHNSNLLENVNNSTAIGVNAIATKNNQIVLGTDLETTTILGKLECYEDVSFMSSINVLNTLYTKSIKLNRQITFINNVSWFSTIYVSNNIDYNNSSNLFYYENSLSNNSNGTATGFTLILTNLNPTENTVIEFDVIIHFSTSNRSYVNAMSYEGIVNSAININGFSVSVPQNTSAKFFIQNIKLIYTTNLNNPAICSKIQDFN